jgi:hypothetical protein
MINSLDKVKFIDDLNDTVSTLFGESFNIRLLIHYIGDIHQPLHTAARFTPSLPGGDLGGNLFFINYTETINELHALWDSGIGYYAFNFT